MLGYLGVQERRCFMFRNVFRLGVWRGQSRLVAAVTLTLLTLSGLLGTFSAHAKDAATSSQETIAVSQLSAHGQTMMTLIYQGGPFRYDKDGTVFANRERFLPVRQRGYYREYTVQTPGERSRGARRIVCGGLRPVAPDACFYTDDHYASFRQVVR
jgi:ribonuclease T1